MSVGVCIINRNGIALAADSAGTFTGNKMFYNSMNKVFSLSRKGSYGAVTYGATAIHNVSIDLVLKEFRTFLDARESLHDFYEILPAFQEFLKDKKEYFKFDTAERGLCIALIKDLVNEWGNKLKKEIIKSHSEESAEAILAELKDRIDNSLKIDNYDVSEYIRNNYRTEYEYFLNMVVPEIKDYLELKEALWKLICECFNLSLVKETDARMGLFFAGYGELDAFPKFVHIELYTVINGELKYKLIERYEESDNNAQIVPLAQTDVILTFCKGISNYFLNYIPQKVEEIINEKLSNLPSDFTEEQKITIQNYLSGCRNDMNGALQAAVQNQYVDPILASVQLIPLPEMAIFAENLVNITSLKRTFAIDGNQQTVGGPTDVAVISKGDGFIWIKRKLYFDKQLNPQYATKLLQD